MSNRVILRFVGEDSDLRRVLRRVADDGGKVGTAFGKIAKPLAVLGAAGGAVKTLGGVAAAGQQLLPIALLLPGALLAGAAAMATFKLATSGFADALSGDAEAMAKLAPSARATVLAVQALRPQFEQLKRSVQDRFFAGFADDVKRIGGEYLPMLHNRLPAIAGDFNTMGRSVAFALTVPDNKNSVDKILGNTHGLLSKMPNALGHVVTGLLTMGGAGSKYLPAIGRWIDGNTDKFRRWADQLVLSGRFDVLVGAAKAGFADLGKIIGNVASIAGSIWKGLSGGSGATSPLATLRDMTGALRGFFETAQAQGPLQALGQTMSVLGGVLKDVVLAALTALAPIVESLAPIVQDLGKAVGDVLVSAFEQLGPKVQRLIDKLAPVAHEVFPFLARVIKDVVIPAIGGLIDWLSNHIDMMQDWAMSTVIFATEAGSAMLGFASGVLGAMERVFAVLGLLPGEFGANMRSAAVSTGQAKRGVDDLRGTVDLMHSKAIDLRAEVLGQRALDDAKHTVDWFPTVKNVRINVMTNYGSIGGPSLVAAAHGRAVGGTVNKGQTYLVGERGPEYLTMPGSGHVTPNHQMAAASAGGGGGNRTVTFAGNTGDALATVIMNLIRANKIQIT